MPLLCQTCLSRRGLLPRFLFRVCRAFYSSTRSTCWILSASPSSTGKAAARLGSAPARLKTYVQRGKERERESTCRQARPCICTHQTQTVACVSRQEGSLSVGLLQRHGQTTSRGRESERRKTTDACVSSSSPWLHCEGERGLACLSSLSCGVCTSFLFPHNSVDCLSSRVTSAKGLQHSTFLCF